jgi:hypothetical protein
VPEEELTLMKMSKLPDSINQFVEVVNRGNTFQRYFLLNHRSSWLGFAIYGWMSYLLLMLFKLEIPDFESDLSESEFE